jgi:hypothetical protein
LIPKSVTCVDQLSFPITTLTYDSNNGTQGRNNVKNYHKKLFIFDRNWSNRMKGICNASGIQFPNLELKN